ncbi:MAG TPA: class I SAM-dependent methyltransferase [Blastocatellia bacterium]|nr:class I SAM-dependent methyltransferase [Blastocatellia bacterium]
MNDSANLILPLRLLEIQQETAALGFAMASDLLTGSLLQTLAASKRGGKLLELGTGTGCATAWVLAGMDAESQLISVESDAKVIDVARRNLGSDPRVSFHCGDAGEWLTNTRDLEFDFIFADTWAGKYTHLEEALQLLKPGGLYIIDDLLPQPNWPDGHEIKVKNLMTHLQQRQDLVVTKLNWSTGIMLAAKKN